MNSTLDLILHAGWVGRTVMVILAGLSVLSWAIIVSKYRSMKVVSAENRKFLDLFWQGKSMDDIFAKAETFQHSSVANVFISGFKELKKLSLGDRTPGGAVEVDNIGRALVRSSQVEISSLERHISWLATTASAAPFIGLFGTVWGIMDSFRNIGATGSANLAVVAPGISEALIATAFGLVAAIPAVVAYNHFLNQIKRVAIDMDGFSQDFINIIQRSYLSGKK